MLTLGLACSAPAWAQTPTLVSVAPDNTTQGNGASGGAVISADGNIVAFTSSATNLVSGDNNGSRDVFVRNLTTNVTTRVSVASDGTERQGDSGQLGSTGPDNISEAALAFSGGQQISMSADGTIIVFSSRAPLVADDTNSCALPGATVNCRDIYVHDTTTGQTTRISMSSSGTQANGESRDPQVSADGRYVVFSSNATNLVAGDTNNTTDVFLHDRVTHTTTRISVSPAGAEGDAPSYSPRISANGRIIAFVSEATTLLPITTPAVCLDAACAHEGYVYDRTTGTLERVKTTGPTFGVPPGASSQANPHLVSVELGNNGRLVFGVTRGLAIEYFSVQDRQTGEVTLLTQHLEGNPFGLPGFAVSPDGRLYHVGATVWEGTVLVTPIPAISMDRLRNVPLSPEPLIAGGAFSADRVHVAGGFGQVYRQSLDTDGDGMPDYWEQTFGLNPNDPSDAALDSDGDGRSNLQEFQADTNPKGTNRRYFAEGAANGFFTTQFALFNPNSQPVTAVLEYAGGNGQRRSASVYLPDHGRATVIYGDTSDILPDQEFSTVIESELPIVADRTMSWDKSGYGSHAETSIASPGTTWYLAEGATHGAFDLFYLLQNPGNTDANVTINYLRPAPLQPVVKTYLLAANSRRTIWVDQEGPELAATDVSAKITSDQPILVERAMYYSTPTQAFAAGHEGAAVEAPGTSWFLAEGATGSFFDLFVLVANAESTDAQIKVTYLLESGAPLVKNYTVPANSRLTINVDGEDPKLVDTPVSTVVESTNSVPVIVERAMWWPSPNWYEAHLSAGATTTGTMWALAEGMVSSVLGSEVETYVLIANTSETDGVVDVTVYPSVGPSKTVTLSVRAKSRISVPVSSMFASAFAPGLNTFGTIIQSIGAQIVVERAVYSNANGVVWAAGTDALGTKLQ